jgi:hypothetical protein
MPEKSKKLYLRASVKNTADVSAIRDLLYRERYGVNFEDDNKKEGDHQRAYTFETKELTKMDDFIFFFATRKEALHLQQSGYSPEFFFMNRWSSF